MAEKLNFIVEFEAAQRSLRGLRKAVEAEFSKTLKLDIQPNARRGGLSGGGLTAQPGSPGRGGARLLTDLAKAREKTKNAEEKLANAANKRAVNLERIAVLEGRLGSLTAEEESSLRSAIKSKGGLTSSENRTKTALDNARNEVVNLSTSFNKLSTVANAVADGLFQQREGGLLEVDTTGFESGIKILETLTKEVIRDVFLPLKRSGQTAKGVSNSLVDLAQSVLDESEIFNKLGFDIEDGRKIVNLAFQQFARTLQGVGINAASAAQRRPEPRAGTRITDDENLARKASDAQAKRLVAIKAAAAADERIALLNQAAAGIISDQLSQQSKIRELQRSAQAAEVQKNAAIQALNDEVLDGNRAAAAVTNRVNDTLELWVAARGALNQSLTIYRGQNTKLREIEVTQAALRDSVNAQKEAADQATRLSLQAAAEIASKNASPGADQLGPTGVNTGRAEVEAAFIVQLREGVDAVARFRSGLFGAIESTDSYNTGARLIARTVNGANRVLENAGVAQSVVADELRSQAAAIIASTASQSRLGTLTQAQADANVLAVQQLLKSARDLEGLSRPITAVGVRADELAIKLGTAASDLVKGILPNATREELVSAAKKFRETFESSGKNTKAAVTKFVNELSQTFNVTASPEQAFAILNASLKTASDKTTGLSDATDQLIASTRGAASKFLGETGQTELNNELKNFSKIIRDLEKEFQGAGEVAARFTAEDGFGALQDGLGGLRNRLIEAVGPGRLEFLSGAGVDVAGTLNEALGRIAKNFEEGFDRAADKIFKDLEQEADKGAKRLGRLIGESAGEEQLDVQAFLKNALDRLAADFPNVTEDALTDIGDKLRRQAEKAVSDRERVNQEVINIREQQAAAEKDILDKIRASVSSAGFESTLRGTGGDNVGGQGPLQDFSLGSLQEFGQKLDIRTQEKFVEVLKNQQGNLKNVNAQLNSHQGNIAKSNTLVDKFTVSMSSGQKAAFQFGFAAANAADRLLAWASPAAFIFGAIASLREAVSTIIRLDGELRRIAFFDAETLDVISRNLRNVGDSVDFSGKAAEGARGSFDKLSNSTERLAVLSQAAALAQEALTKRARETGVELEKLAEIALVAGRVGRRAFEGTEITSFGEAIEGLTRLEGASGNAAELTAQLNSVLNQFNLTAEDSSVISAQLAEASQRTAFSVGELAEGMTRVAGAFSTVQQATPAQTLEFLTAAGNTAQTSVARVSTALRQLSVNVAEGADEIREFSGLDIVEDGKLRGPEALIDVLKQINQFEGSEAAIEFITRFTDKRNASIILSLARGVDGLAENLGELGKSGGEANAALRAQTRFLAAVENQSRSLESQFSKLRSTVIDIVSRSGFIDFLSSTVGFGTKAASIVGDFVSAIGGLGGAFALVAGLALPTLQSVAKGFVAGLLPAQKQQEVISQIVISLDKEKNVVKAVNVALDEGLLTVQKANELRQKGLTLTIEESIARAKIIGIEAELAILSKQQVPPEREILALEKQREAVLRNIRRIEQDNLALRQSATKSIADPKLNNTFLGINKNKLAGVVSSALLIGGSQVADEVAQVIGKRIGDEAGKEVGAALQGAIPGAAIGATFGPIGALIGGLITGTISLLNKQSELVDIAKRQAAEQSKVLQTLRRQEELSAQRLTSEADAVGRISTRQRQILTLRDAIESIDVRIRKIGNDRAEQEGLIEARNKNQLDLNRKLAQQKELENEQLKRQLEFEKGISEAKREQEILTRVSNLAQRAQVAILKETVDKPIIEAEIQAVVDERALEIEKRRIINSIKDVERRLFEVNLSSNAKQQQAKLSKERLKLADELADRELKVIETGFKKAEEQIAAREQVIDSEINRFREVGNFLSGSFQSLIDSQQVIVGLIQEEADVFASIADVQKEAGEQAARGQRLGVVRDITDLNIRQQRSIISRRNRIIEEGAQRFSRLLLEQLSELGNVPSLEDLKKNSESLATAIDDIGGPLTRFRVGLDEATRLQIEQIDSNRQLFEIERSQTLKSIELQKNARLQENELIKQKIEVVKQEIDIVQLRLQKEAELGDKLITAPGEFLNETRKLFSAQNVVSAARIDSTNVEAGLLRVVTRINEASGVEGLQVILEGFKVAQERGVELITGILPSQLTSLFQRLVVNPSAKLQAAAISEQQQLINQISNLNQNILKNNNEIVGFIRQQRDIETLFRNTLPELAEKQLVEISKQTTAIVDSAQRQIAALGFSREAIEGLSEKVIALQDELLAGLDLTSGDKAIKTAVDNVASILEKIRDNDEQSRSTDILKSVADKITEVLRPGALQGEGDVAQNFRGFRADEIAKSFLVAKKATDEIRKNIEKAQKEVTEGQAELNRIAALTEGVRRASGVAPRIDTTNLQTEVEASVLKLKKLNEQLDAITQGRNVNREEDFRIQEVTRILEAAGIDFTEILKNLGGDLNNALEAVRRGILTPGGINLPTRTRPPEPPPVPVSGGGSGGPSPEPPPLPPVSGAGGGALSAVGIIVGRIFAQSLRDAGITADSFGKAIADADKKSSDALSEQGRGLLPADIELINSIAKVSAEDDFDPNGLAKEIKELSRGRQVQLGVPNQDIQNLLGFDFEKAFRTRIGNFSQEGGFEGSDEFAARLQSAVEQFGINVDRLGDEAARAIFGGDVEAGQLPGGISSTSAIAGGIAQQLSERLRSTTGAENEELKKTILETFAPGRLAEEINAGRSATEDRVALETALKNVMNDPLARQIAAMERIIAVNEGQFVQQGLFGSLDAEGLAVAKENLEQLKAQFSLQQGSDERLNSIKESLNAEDEAPGFIPAGLDNLFTGPNAPKVTAQLTGQETGKAVVAANVPIVEGIARINEQGITTTTTLDSLSSNSASTNSLLRELIEQQKKQAEEDVPRLEIDEASREDFINLFGEKFDAVCKSWIEQLTTTLNDNSLKIDADAVEIELTGRVRTEIVGDDFISQLTQVLLQAGLEDKVDAIIQVLAPIVQFHVNKNTGVISGDNETSFGSLGKQSGSSSSGARPGPTR